MRARVAGRVAVLSLLAGLVSCRSAIPVLYQVEPVPDLIGLPNPACPDSDRVAVTYLGVAGFAIQYRGHTLLTAPEFTNPSLDSVTPTQYRFFRGPAPDIVSNRPLI